MQRYLHGVVVAMLEVFQGRRPMQQLGSVFDQDAQAALKQLLDETTGELIGLRSLRTQMPTPYVVEVVSHLNCGTRSRAVAFRLNLRAGKWRCTNLELASTSGVVTYAAASSSA